MVRIIADTSTMYSSAEAEAAGFSVSPLSVSIGGKTYRELDEISSEELVRPINQGHKPTSSQPALGDVITLYERWDADEVLNLSMADGLSGTYATAVAARDSVSNGKHIEVINTGTLCGPHRYMAEAAAQMARSGATLQQIKDRVHALMETDLAFLIPSDFDFLRRGGRLSPLVSLVGKAIRLAPGADPVEGRPSAGDAHRQPLLQAGRQAHRQGAEGMGRGEGLAHLCGACRRARAGGSRPKPAEGAV